MNFINKQIRRLIIKYGDTFPLYDGEEVIDFIQVPDSGGYLITVMYDA